MINNIEKEKENSELKIEEGYMPFLSYKTYYRIVGDKKNNNKKPLLILHGGPGSTHTALEVLDKISYIDDRQLIYYDQIGCGNSYLEGHPELWKLETWIEELKEIRKFLKLDEVHIVGHSWGGMLEIAYISDISPSGVKSAILSSALSSSKLWGEEQHVKIRYLSEEDQNGIFFAELTDNYFCQEYFTANQHFMQRHCNYAVNENSPECLKRPVMFGKESYNVAWGPNEFTPQGTLKNFDYTEKMKKWTVPTLIISGTEDLCSPLIAKTMFDAVPNSKWELFKDCKHCGFADYNDKFVKILIDWMNKYD